MQRVNWGGLSGDASSSVRKARRGMKRSQSPMGLQWRLQLIQQGALELDETLELSQMEALLSSHQQTLKCGPHCRREHNLGRGLSLGRGPCPGQDGRWAHGTCGGPQTPPHPRQLTRVSWLDPVNRVLTTWRKLLPPLLCRFCTHSFPS